MTFFGLVEIFVQRFSSVHEPQEKTEVSLFEKHLVNPESWDRSGVLGFFGGQLL